MPEKEHTTKASLQDKARYAAFLTEVPSDANKFSRGSLLVAGGSTRFTGAPVLAVQAALAAARTGAGYVSLLVPDSVVAIAQTYLLSIPVIGASSTEGTFDGASARALAQLTHLDALVLGPGLTVSAATCAFVAHMLAQVDVPLVLDADGLNAVAADKQVRDALLDRHKRGVVTILTPHAGELERLEKALHLPSVPESPAETARAFEVVDTLHGADLQSASEHQEASGAQAGTFAVSASDGSQSYEGDRRKHAGASAPSAPALSTFTLSAPDGYVLRAMRLAHALGSVVVAKGPDTVITQPGDASVEEVLVSSVGGPELARAGTGDVLAGIIGSLLAQGLEPYPAAALGVYLHSRAGAFAAEKLGVRSVMAEDVIVAIPQALKELESARSPVC